MRCAAAALQRILGDQRKTAATLKKERGLITPCLLFHEGVKAGKGVTEGGYKGVAEGADRGRPSRTDPPTTFAERPCGTSCARACRSALR